MRQKAGDLLDEFTRELTSTQPDLERAALLVSGVVSETVDMGFYLAEMERVAAIVGADLPPDPGRERADYFLDALYHRIGFVGNKTEYYDPRNSYLTEVLERRTGLPILLSVIYIAIGRRLELQIEGVGLPLHFMVRYSDAEGEWLLDPFHGRLLLMQEVETYLSGLYQQRITIPPASLRPTSVPDMIKRILVNLRNVYVNSGHYDLAARTVDHLLRMAPNEATWWQERALFHYHSNEIERAVRDIRRYFFLTDRLHLTLDNFADVEEREDSPLQGLSSSDRHLLELLDQIEEMRTRLN